MRRSQLGWLLLTVGIFVPIITVPFAEGYRQSGGLVENIQSMTLPIVPDRYEPNFRELGPGELRSGPFIDVNTSTGELSPRTTPVADYGDYGVIFLKHDVGKVRLFPNGGSDDEIAKAVKAGKQQIEKSEGKYLMYYGWTLTHKGFRLPFSFLVSASSLLIFVGIVLLIFAPRRV